MKIKKILDGRSKLLPVLQELEDSGFTKDELEAVVYNCFQNLKSTIKRQKLLRSLPKVYKRYDD